MPKTVKKEDIIVGKDILELLGSAMYADPLNVYREYVQNAVDSIDEATERSLYSNSLTPRIDIIQKVLRKAPFKVGDLVAIRNQSSSVMSQIISGVMKDYPLGKFLTDWVETFGGKEDETTSTNSTIS